MPAHEPLWRDHERYRLVRPNAHLYIRHDAHRYIRHDAHRFMPPGAPRWDGKDVVRSVLSESASGQSNPHNSVIDPAIERANELQLLAERQEMLRLKSDLLLLKLELKFRALLRSLKYRPDQPRVPAGNPDGGQWTTEGGYWSKIRFAQLGGTLTDAYGEPYYQKGGHHEVPKATYQKWVLPPETRRVFDNATSGTIGNIRIRATPEGIPQGHLWNGPSGAHGIYNKAVDELANRFVETRNIDVTRPMMTPDQARELLKEVRESPDPGIRDYNAMIRLLRRLFRLRTGRGTE